MISRAWAVLLTGALSVLAMGGLAAALEAPRQLNLATPLFSAAPLDATAFTPRRRTLMIVIDGLREDTARSLPVLSALARRGTSLNVWAEAPTFSASQYVALLTGVPPRDSGVRDNAGLRAAGLDSIASRVRDQGRATLEMSDDVDWWAQLFGPAWSRAEVSRPDDLVDRVVTAFGAADFALVHLCGVDSAGHNWGGSSAAYRTAALKADRQLVPLVHGWQGPVVVLADHGHVPAGGHGGEEDDVRKTWLVLAGPGIHEGLQLADAANLDIAPTVAALLGAPAPASAEGRTLVDALDLAPGVRQQLERSDLDRIGRVMGAVRKAREAFSAHDWLARALRGWGVLGLVGLTLGAARRFRSPLTWGLRAGVISALATLCLHLLIWGPFSFSSSNKMGLVIAEAALLSAGLSVLVLGWARRHVLRPGALGDDVALAFGFGAGAAPFAALCFVAVGAFAPRLVCEPSWLAAAPMVAYAAFVPPALLALGCSLPGLGRVLRARAA